MIRTVSAKVDAKKIFYLKLRKTVENCLAIEKITINAKVLYNTLYI